MLPVAPQTEALACPHLSELWGLREKVNSTNNVLLPGDLREDLVPDA